MENKVLIKLLFPELENSFDVYIPINEVIWKIKKLFVKSISDLCGMSLESKDYILINKSSGKIYLNNDVIINTDIRNGTELFLISIN